MKAIVLLNEKGGVGKTTLSTHLAAGLAILGYRIVLVDADPQGHATIAMNQTKAPGLYDLIVRDRDFRDVLRPISADAYAVPDEPPRGELYLVPSNVETRLIPMAVNDPFAISNRFEELNEAVDFVIFDTAPTPSLLHGSIYLATDAIIYPTKLEYFSFDGLKESITHLDSAQKKRREQNMPEIVKLGIVPVMSRLKTINHDENLKKLQNAFGDLVWNPIPQRVLWSECTEHRQLIFRYAPTSSAAADAWELVKQAEERIHRWLAKSV